MSWRHPTTDYYYIQHTHILSAPSHWCHDERPHSGTVPYTEGPALIHPY